MNLASGFLGWTGWLGRIVSGGALPPPSAAGFVHRTSTPGGIGPPDGFRGAPNRLVVATGRSTVENAITHPRWVADQRARVFRESRPMSSPFFTNTLPPSRIAETSRFTTDAT